MPPKGKKPKAESTKLSTATPPPTAATTTTAPPPAATPETIHARTLARYTLARPHENTPLSALSPQAQAVRLASRIASRLAAHPSLSAATTASAQTTARLACGGGPKTVKEVWRAVNDGSVPLRVARPRKEGNQKKKGETVREFEERWERKVVLGCLRAESRCFKVRRGVEGFVTEQEALDETRRRREMAALQRELYGGGVGKEGRLAGDPEWDDVSPIVMVEPEKALAAITYTADYAEAMSYLRAVMQAKEYSPRCLRLTEHIIGMNPAHYTVWLYRAANVFALKLPIPDEMAWLNRIALANLKNYQIWHHRHLLVENYFPAIASDPAAVSAFAASERLFLAKMLAEDTKNYHVWSYRSYLVGKLGLFSDPDELRAIDAMISDDVRNNSAWSHRFFLVFSDPAASTPGAPATAADPAVPADVVDRELAYAQDKIALAPQNQSGWNYLRGVLVKGGRKLASVEEFAAGFVTGLVEGGEDEDVRSTHALDLLAEIYAEKGDRERADLSLRRLGQKWDRIRVGYWEWRRKCLEVGA